MQFNYFPGRLRFRDPVLRDKDIRDAALEVLNLICPDAQITYKESTAGILALYPAEKVEIERLKEFVPLLLKIEPKIRFYNPSKKEEILKGIENIKTKVKTLKRSL